MRETVWAASLVWSEVRTRCPVSAAVNAAAIGILPEDGADCLGKSRCVGTYFDLLHERELIRLLKFDWVFDGDDVVVSGAIDGVDQSRHGGGFAAAGGPREQDQPLAPFGERGKRLRKVAAMVPR